MENREKQKLLETQQKKGVLQKIGEIASTVDKTIDPYLSKAAELLRYELATLTTPRYVDNRNEVLELKSKNQYKGECTNEERDAKKPTICK